MQAYLSQQTHLRARGGQQHEALQQTLQQQQGDTWQREHLCFTGLQWMWLERIGLAFTGDSYLGLSFLGVSLRGLDDFNGLEARGLALMGDELRQGLQQQGAIQQVEHE
jgi:hypothetical protein